MKLLKLLLLMSLCLFAAAASAQENKASPPCARGQTTARLGGIDLDVVKCQLLLLQAQVGDLYGQLAGLDATLRLQKNDYDGLVKERADDQSKLNNWSLWYKAQEAEIILLKKKNALAVKN